MHALEQEFLGSQLGADTAEESIFEVISAFAKCVKAFSLNIRTWVSDLREGSTKDLNSLCLKACEDMYGAFESDESHKSKPYYMEVMTHIVSCVTEIPEGRALHVKIQDALTTVEADLAHTKLETLMDDALRECNFATVVELAKKCAANNMLFLSVKHQWESLVGAVALKVCDPAWWADRPHELRSLTIVFEFSTNEVYKLWHHALAHTADMYEYFEKLPSDAATRENVAGLAGHIRNVEKAYNAVIDVDESFRTFLDVNIKDQFNNVKDDLLDDAAAVLQHDYDNATKSTSLAKQIMRGGTKGRCWAEKCPAAMPILDWFQQSLAKVDTSQLDAYRQRAQAAAKTFDTELKSHGNLFSDHHDLSAKFDIQGLHNSLAALSTDFEITKHEWLFGSTLMKNKSSKFMQRMNLYVGTAYTALGAEWRSKLKQALRAEIDKHVKDATATVPALGDVAA